MDKILNGNFYSPTKGNLKIEDVLTHQAGFKSWIPFYKRFLDSSNTLNPRFFSRQSSAHFSRCVAENIFANKILHDTIMAIIEHSELGPKKYLYSDLGYYYLQEIIEHITGKSLDAVIEPIYKQMNLQLTYLPLQGFPKSQIAPTEQDDQFRKQLVHGYVHDPGAAINGGVSGHAGLFGNALDVATLMQMFMQKGVYQNQIILDSNVVKAFTRTPYFKGNRRALCFDKPETNNKKTSPVIESCSSESFGHSGFTGTFAWADPKSQLVYVFLSNRVYPDAENPSILRLKTRQKIHELAYQLIQSL